MKNRLFLFLIIISLVVASAVIANAQGTSPTSPAAVGKPVDSMVYCGANPVTQEPYDIKITLLQVVRGKEAWQMLQQADAANPAAKPGYDYVLARLGFELKARVSPGNKSFTVGAPLQLVAMSADGQEYEGVTVTRPKPELGGALAAGKTLEGWVVFQVDQKDKKAILYFDPASGGGTLRGNILFFQLY
jgi:hypothetical protein